jgi:hypothetical protein
MTTPNETYKVPNSADLDVEEKLDILKNNEDAFMRRELENGDKTSLRWVPKMQAFLETRIINPVNEKDPQHFSGTRIQERYLFEKPSLCLPVECLPNVGVTRMVTSPTKETKKNDGVTFSKKERLVVPFDQWVNPLHAVKHLN